MDLCLVMPMEPTSDGLGPDPDFFPLESEGEESTHNPLDIPSSIP